MRALQQRPAGLLPCGRTVEDIDRYPVIFIKRLRTAVSVLVAPCCLALLTCIDVDVHKGKGRPYSITERRVPELIPVLGSQPAGDVSHEPGGRLPLLSARPAVTPATLKRTATNFAAW